MKRSMTILAAALALASGAALAQGATGVGAAASAGTTGVSVDSHAGTGGIAPADGSNRLASGASGSMGAAASATTTPVVVAPATMPAYNLLPGGTMVQADSSTSVNGNTTIVTTRYWANVPAGVAREAEFQRWSRLK